MLAQRNAQLPVIDTCAGCFTPAAVVNRHGECSTCAAKMDAYNEGLRQAALESLYTATDNLVAGGWDLARICDALHRRREVAI